MVVLISFKASAPVLIDVLDLVDLLLNALAGYAVGLKLINLLVDQIGDGFMKVLQEVLDDLRDHVVRLLVLILAFISQISFRVTCRTDKQFLRHCLFVVYKLNVAQYSIVF